jgi:FixJ family two-component response regulator
MSERPPTARPPAKADAAVVYVIDDDASLRDALSSLFRSVGLTVVLFSSAQEMLQSTLTKGPACMVLDIRLPGLSGLDLQGELIRAGVAIPVIFITGHGDIPMSVRAMKAGAVDFLTKPFRDQDMLDAVTSAIARDRQRAEDEQQFAQVRKQYESLTPRERQVMGYVTTGLMNKQIANEVGLSEITVKIHRGQVMRKMAARSVAELVRMSDALGLPRPPSTGSGSPRA